MRIVNLLVIKRFLRINLKQSINNSILFCLLLLLLFSFNSRNANGIEISEMTLDDAYLQFEWEENHSGEQSSITITNYIGTDTDVIIPQKIGNFTVTRIGNSAFMYKKLKSVIIPNSVNSIMQFAFMMNSLEEIVIPDNVTSINQSAFLANNLHKLIIPDNVRYIGVGAFGRNTELTSIIIGKSVVTIEENAFRFCRVEEVFLPQNLKRVGSYAFAFGDEFGSRTWWYLKKITIGNNVEIGEKAFPDDFIRLYNSDGKKSGTYILTNEEMWRKE